MLFAESFNDVKGGPPLTALEVLETLRFIPRVRRNMQFEMLRSLLERCGKLEAYFLAKLLMRNAGFGFDYQGPLLSKLLGERFKVSTEQVEHAMALTDPLARRQDADEDGAEGLRQIQLQPLSPVRPALAAGTVDDIKKYPVWVERKYDGIRLLLHKSTDARGAVLCGAYTRNRGDWLEMIPGMPPTIRMIPAGSVIVDGELYGMVVDLDGAPTRDRLRSLHDAAGRTDSPRAAQVRRVRSPLPPGTATSPACRCIAAGSICRTCSPRWR